MITRFKNKILILVTSTLIFTSCTNDLYKDFKDIQVCDLGYSFKMPSKYFIDTIKGGTDLFIKINDSTTICDIARQPKNITKKDFLESSKSFVSADYSNLTIDQDTSYLTIDFRETKYYFRFIQTDYYNFLIWSKNDTLIQAINNTIKIDYDKLMTDFKNKIDYEIAGNKIVNFYNNDEVLSRLGNNFFTVNLKDDDIIDFMPSPTNGTVFRRTSNYYNITNIKSGVDSIGLNIIARFKNGQMRFVYKAKYKVK
jgi:hypothetical protein